VSQAIVEQAGGSLTFDSEPGRLASSGREALELIGSGETYDLILCDMMMPDLSGMDVYDALADAHPEVLKRVVFMSGGAFTERARAFRSAVTNTCSKSRSTRPNPRPFAGRRAHRFGLSLSCPSGRPFMSVSAVLPSSNTCGASVQKRQLVARQTKQFASSDPREAPTMVPPSKRSLPCPHRTESGLTQIVDRFAGFRVVPAAPFRLRRPR
jgi:CheY-like chemotaxis protein